MRVVENRVTGTVHLPGEETTTLCGSMLIVGGEENAHWKDDAWLDDFPEDFGDSLDDCKVCAEMADF